jgi:gamma-glutamyltranspeptidase/glutathione hydrolase
MVVTNNPWASKAAQRLLDKGGNAIDAAIAAAFVLGLTEPQSSGIGGGGYALTYHATNKQLTAYDGRESAPHSATPGLFLDENGQLIPFKKTMLSPESIGVPGEIALLYKLHQKDGRLPWNTTIQPAIELATQGFPMSPRLHHLLTEDQSILIKDPIIKHIYFNKNRQVKSCNTLIKNPEYAKTLASIVKNPREFYTGKIAKDIIKKINHTAHKTLYRATDFSRYQPIIGNALCHKYRAYMLCSTPFSSGGVSLLELMSLYAAAYAETNTQNPTWMYYFLEASKLAYADRNQYIADPTFIKVPFQGLLAEDYLQSRSQLIQKNKAMRTPVKAGTPKEIRAQYAPDIYSTTYGTTSLAIVDKDDNAISMTLSIEHQFGSHIFVHGFFLNNELTDFSPLPTNNQGLAVANRVEAFKRPRSAIAPAFVFDPTGKLFAISGSPGGAQIICYIAKNLIQILDFNQNAKDSCASGNLCSLNTNPEVEVNSNLIKYIPKLTRTGERILLSRLLSGVVVIKRSNNNAWEGAADPRREGMSIGH